MKLALNCARAGTEVLERAAATGLARVLDLPGPAARCWEAAAAFAKADTETRVVARVGYVAGQGKHIAHSLDAGRVAAEAARCAALLGRPLDVLLHGPEEVPREARRDVVAAAAAAIRAAGGALTVGIATRDATAVEAAWWDDALDGPLRLPATCADGAATRAQHATLAAAGIELLGCAPLRSFGTGGVFASPFRGTADLGEYVPASQRVLAHFEAPGGADADVVEGCAWVHQLVSDLNASLPGFDSFERWEHEIATQLVPLLHNKFDGLDEDSVAVLWSYFEAYGKAVRANADRAARAAAARCADVAAPLRDGERLEAWALRDAAVRPLALVSVGVQSVQDVDGLARALASLDSPAPREAACAVAHRALAAGAARYLDCRSEMEVVAQGGVAGSCNMPYPHNGDNEPVPAAEFLEDVELEFGRDEVIYVGCQSGNRSALAVEVLRGAGYARAVNVAGGIQAWRAAGLPLEPYAGWVTCSVVGRRASGPGGELDERAVLYTNLKCLEMLLTDSTFFICREVEVRIRSRLGLGLGLGESRVRAGPK